MKIIKATNGQEIKVSDCDYPLLSRHVWTVQNTGYAVTSLGGRYIPMHSIVTGGTKRGGQVTDHINRDKLDNRTENLREVSASINSLNVGKRTSQKVHYQSIYVGVFLKKSGNKESFEAGMSLNNRYFYIGRFDTPEKAGFMRDAFAYMVHGDFVFLNFPENVEEYKTFKFPDRVMERYEKWR